MLYCMIKKSRMHRFPYLIISAKRKRNIGNASAHLSSWKIFFDPFTGIEKVYCIIVVFLHSGCNRKNIGVKNNIGRFKTNFIYEDIIGFFTYINSTLKRICLTKLIECHNDYCRAKTFNFFGVKYKSSSAFFQGNRIYYSFTLNAF